MFSLIFFNFIEGNIPTLETATKGRHLEIKHSLANSNLNHIKLNERNCQELIKNPAKLIKQNTEWNVALKSSLKTEIDFEKVLAKLQKEPYLLFLECVCPECPLTRTHNPKPRRLFEEKVLAEAVKRVSNQKDSSLHITFFGSSFLFDTLVHLAQILEKKPALQKLEIDLVDIVYSEYIAYIKENSLEKVASLTFPRMDKQNWYNLTTLRFAVFSSLLAQLAPKTLITLRVYGSLSNLSEDLVDGTVKATSDLVIAGDLFDPGGGAYAAHDFLVDGAKVTDIGAVLLKLSRCDENWIKKYHIGTLVKQIPAETSRKIINNIIYTDKDSRFDKMEKRFKCLDSQFREMK